MLLVDPKLSTSLTYLKFIAKDRVIIVGFYKHAIFMLDELADICLSILLLEVIFWELTANL